MTQALWMIVAIAVILAVMLGGCVNSLHSERATITVTDKTSVPQGKSGYKYIIFTDGTTYEVVDSWIWWRFNSSDVYGRIERGHTYSITGQGYRIPFFSMYPNIVEISEVK